MQVNAGGFVKKALFNWGYHRKLAFLDKGLPFDKVRGQAMLWWDT
jgi:hypothetical protein